MKIFKSKYKLQKEILDIKNISFVPTMGGLHKGHIHLIDKSKEFKRKILVSIFINPKQFNNKRDYLKYPRNYKKDISTLRTLKIDYLYLPKKNDIYNHVRKSKIRIYKKDKILCAKHRKGHFEGVIDVMDRLTNKIRPKIIFMGEKDFQQLYLIKKHFKINKIDTNIIECKTIRETNGLACSTRNKNLNKKDIEIASKIYHYLKNNKKKFPIKVVNLKDKLVKFGADKIDYLEFLNVKTLKKPKTKNENYRIFVAYYLKKTRLIDNI